MVELSLHDEQEIFRKNVAVKYWKEIKTANIPERRSNHATFVYKNKLYVHGGQDTDEGCRSTMWSFNLEKNKDWQLVDAKPVVHRK